MRVVGLTGGIACGKTTVADILKLASAEIIDADQIAHDIYSTNPKLVASIGQAFPGVVVNGVIDRVVLGKTIFPDAGKRA
jgi:dephospho-CoA kinase